MLATRPLQTTTTVSWKRAEVSVESVRQTGKKTNSERLKWIGTIVFCTVVLSMMIGQFSSIAKLNMDVENLKIAVDNQTIVNEKLSNRKNEMSSPARVIAKAREMGMVSANPGVIARAGKE